MLNAALVNCVFIGRDAGADVIDGTGLVIVGDDVRDLDPAHNTDALFIGENVAIGKTLFGRPFDLQAILKDHMADA